MKEKIEQIKNKLKLLEDKAFEFYLEDLIAERLAEVDKHKRIYDRFSKKLDELDENTLRDNFSTSDLEFAYHVREDNTRLTKSYYMEKAKEVIKQ